MFINFFYSLRDHGIPVSPTSFLRLHKALNTGQVLSLKDLYTVARSTLVKSERYFDSYDQLFAHYFEGAEMPPITDLELDEIARALLEEWLKNPAQMADALGIDESKLKKYTPEELIQYFLDRLKEQTKEHHGGDRWIGTGGTSPVGHSGVHPGGMLGNHVFQQSFDASSNLLLRLMPVTVPVAVPIRQDERSSIAD